MIFDGWDNADITIEESTASEATDGSNTQCFQLDITKPRHWMEGQYDYIFCNHMLSDFSHHELPTVLHNIRWLLTPLGVAHILVPNLFGAIKAYFEMDHGWFPQGLDMPNLDERLCTFVTWFGESKSVFTPTYLLTLGRRAGFSAVDVVLWGTDPHDDREKEAIVVEFTR